MIMVYCVMIEVEINGEAIGIMDCISKYLLQSKEGQETEVYGYALHVEVIGMKIMRNKGTYCIIHTRYLMVLLKDGKN